MKPSLLIKNAKVFTGNKDEKATIKNILITNGVFKKISSEEISVDENT